ncbi:MAG: MFS transporter [Thermodesulfobacteriota bacterium]
MKSSKPSGVYYGFIIVAVCFVLQAVGWGIFNSLGVFFKPLMTEFAWPRSLVASATSLGMLIAGTGAIVLGRLSDKYGPRLTMAISGIFLGCGFILMARISTLWHMYLNLSLIAAIGVSGTDAVLLSTTTRWFIKYRGMMIGIVKVGTGVGMLIMPLLITYFIGTYNWRTAFVILGILCLVAYITGSQLLVRDPGKKGLAIYGNRAETPYNHGDAEEGVTLKAAIRTVPFWLIGASFFIVLFCVVTILIHVVPHAIDLGISPSNAAKVLSTVGALSIAGRLLIGAAGDRVGNRNALIICFGFLCLGTIWLQFADRLWMLYLFACIHGFAHGGFFALIAPVLADYFGTRDQGVILGIVIFIANLGSSIGPVLAGYVFDVTGSYRVIFMALTGLSLVGLCSAYLLRPVQR